LVDLHVSSCNQQGSQHCKASCPSLNRWHVQDPWCGYGHSNHFHSVCISTAYCLLCLGTSLFDWSPIPRKVMPFARADAKTDESSIVGGTEDNRKSSLSGGSVTLSDIVDNDDKSQDPQHWQAW
jgi:hypothetical protein